MRYTTLGKTNLRVSVLGFGCMRLPMKGSQVDRDLAIPLLRRAVDLGINFFDTATMYCGSDSEKALGEAMEGLRDQVVLSTKNPLRGVTPDQWRARLEESLRNLRTDHLDVYHHHGIGWTDYLKNFNPSTGGLTKAMLQAKEEGLIRHCAFSFHDSPDALMKLADTGYYENVILQYNLLDQSNAEAIAYVHEKGMGVVVMGPVGGGRLGLASESIAQLTGAKSTVEAALRFVWAHPGVNVALSGMQNLEMLEMNVRLAEAATPFTAGEVERLNKLVRERKEKSGMYCSGCKYCVPVCGAGIPIPELLDLLNQFLVFGIDNPQRYANYKITPADCLDCGRCLKACPQKLDIPNRLRDAAEKWDKRFGSLIVSPLLDDLEADGSFKVKFRLHNFAREATPVRVHLTPGETTLVDTVAETPTIPSFKRQTVTFSGQTDPAGNRLSFRAAATAHGRQTDLAVNLRYLLLPAANPTDWSSGSWHEFRAAPADFTEGASTAGKHGVRFRLSRDAEALILYAEVKDDFLRPSRAEQDRGNYGVDLLELYLDGRAPARQGIPTYDKDVYQVFLYPGTPGVHPAFSHCREPLAVDITSFPAPGGYRLIARIPFQEFCVGGGPPRKFGFDLAVNTADASGRRIGQFIFAGDKNNWQDASHFATVWLTDVD